MHPPRPKPKWPEPGAPMFKKPSTASTPATARAETRTSRRPRTEQERTLCELVAELLGEPTVDIDDGFFALGGDSIVAIQLVSRAHDRGLGISVRDVFRHPTLGALANAATQSAPAPHQDDSAGTVPLTPITHWWLTQPDTDRASFSQCVTLRTPPGLRERHLVDAVHRLVVQHPALRLRLELNDQADAPSGAALEVTPPRFIPADPSASTDPAPAEYVLRVDAADRWCVAVLDSLAAS